MRRAILFVHPSDELYGSDRCLLDIVQGLPDSDQAIVVLPADVQYKGILSRELNAAGAIVERVDMLVLRRALLRPAQLPALGRRLVGGTIAIMRLMKKHDVSLAHSNTVAVLCGASAAALQGIPHVWHVHEHIGDEPRLYKVLIRLLLNLFPGRIIANSRQVARSLIGGSARLLSRTRVIENSVDPLIQPSDRTSRDPESAVVIGVVGRLAARKGIAEAIDAAAVLARREKAFELRFVGDVSPGDEVHRTFYDEQVKRLNLQEYVVFHGQSTDIKPQFASFDILLLPSQRPEPFGLVVIEGMAAGLPVVATLNGGGSDDILDHGKTGIYCGRDPQSIANALETLIDDRQERLNLGSAAASVAATRYTRSRYLQQILRVYRYTRPAECRTGC